jgi:hypothetical protein
MFNRAQRRVSGWVAIAAMLLSALAPSVSHALASWTGNVDFLQQICSAQTAKQVRPGDGLGKSGQGDAPASFEHCPYCSIHNVQPAVPPTVTPAAGAPAGKAVQGVGAGLQPRTPVDWLAPRSRAPPL